MADWRRVKERIITDSQGQIGAIAVTVKLAGTDTLATLKANKAGTEAQTNPFNTDAYGVLTFFVDVETLVSSDYELDISFVKSGYGFSVMNEMYENFPVLGVVVESGTVLESDFDATTFLYATLDDTPEAKTPAEVMAILSGQAIAAFDFNGQDLTNCGVIFLTEQAAAEAAVVGKGQIWVKTGAPNTLWFTNEDGTDQQVAYAGVNADITGLTALATQSAVQINPFGTNAGETGEIRFLELAVGGTHYMGFKAADALAGTVIWTLPDTDSTGTQFLVSDGSGVLSWSAGGGGGDVTKVGTPVNSQIGVWTGDGTIEGDTKFTWDETVFTVLGALTVGVDNTGHDVTFFGATTGAYFKFDQATDAVWLQGGATKQMELRFYEDTDNGSAYSAFKAHASTTTVTYIWPAADSTGTQYLRSDGSGNLAWATIAGGGDVLADGSVPFDGAVSVGIDGAGVDITFFGAVADYKAWWDANGDTNGAFYFGADTKGILFSLFGDVTGCGVFWDPTTDTNGTLSIGAAGGSKGVDLVAYGATNGNYMHWDRSADDLLLVGTSTQLAVAGDTDSSSITTGSLRTAGGLGVVKTLYVGTGASITGASTFIGAVTVGVDDTGHDVKFFGASAGAFSLWDQANDMAILRGPLATPGVLTLQTAETTVVDGNKLGQIDFQAPLDSAGTDAIVVGASIWAEADDTFAADNNSTDIVFAAAASGAAVEVMRVTHDATLGLTCGQIAFPATAVPSTDANTLDEYEEGTWTPTYVPETGAFGAITYRFQHGKYTKIGNVVVIACQIATDDIPIGTAADDVRISGLPFTSTGTYNNGLILGFTSAWGGDYPLNANVTPNESIVIRLYYKTSVNGASISSKVSDLDLTTDYGNTCDVGGNYFAYV